MTSNTLYKAFLGAAVLFGRKLINGAIEFLRQQGPAQGG